MHLVTADLSVTVKLGFLVIFVFHLLFGFRFWFLAELLLKGVHVYVGGFGGRCTGVLADVFCDGLLGKEVVIL
jgi:hypothetical protein